MLGALGASQSDLGASFKPKPRTSSLRPSISAETASPVARTAVSLEYASLRNNNHCPLGMYVVPSAENLMIWDAVFFVHQGYYANGVLKFRLTFPSDYPEHPPTVQFITDVFHPLIAQNGNFNLSYRFHPWRPKEHHVFDVLHCIKAAFKRHTLDQIKEPSCWNKEAFRLYHSSISSFAALAEQTSQLSTSSSALFDGDYPSATAKPRDGLPFRKLTVEQLQEGRVKIGLTEWDATSQSS